MTVTFSVEFVDKNVFSCCLSESINGTIQSDHKIIFEIFFMLFITLTVILELQILIEFLRDKNLKSFCISMTFFYLKIYSIFFINKKYIHLFNGRNIVVTW